MILLAWACIAVATMLLILAALYAKGDLLVNDSMLIMALILELGLLLLAGLGLAQLGQVAGGSTEQATFAAYLVSLPVITAGTVFLAIKEKTRWAMGAVAIGAFAVAVMTLRVLQIWGSRG